MKTRFAVGAAGVLFRSSVAVFAHHAFQAEYDATKPVKVTGVVKKVEWTNPHIWFYVDVKDDSGKITTWGFSGGPPGMLMRRGITRDVLKPGDTVKVEGFRAKDGSNNASGGKRHLCGWPQSICRRRRGRCPAIVGSIVGVLYEKD